MKHLYKYLQKNNDIVIQEEILLTATNYYIDTYGLSIERFKLIIKEKEEYKK